MPTLKEIRARIDSTKNTQQITRAMKLVSAAKLRRAQQNIVNMRPYAISLKRMIADIANSQSVSHPLMQRAHESKKVLFVVLTSDRGLCGAFNTNINKFAEAYWKQNNEHLEKMDFFFIGKKGADFFSKRGINGVESITKLDKDISYDLASHVADRLLKVFLSGQYDEIRLVYNEFKSAISQLVVAEKMLPIELDVADVEVAKKHEGSNSKEIIFEPGAHKIIEQLLVKHFDLQVYRAMSESVASEHGARMTSMENATNNAKAMIESLTLTYNKLRQEKITKELIEIVSGAEALA
jgi:F-type H+-transporting ATPase subunit gamma